MTYPISRKHFTGKSDDRKKEHEMPDSPRGSERGKEHKKRETTGNNGESEKYDFSREDIKIEGRETPQRDDRCTRRDPPRSKSKEEIRS